MSKQRTEAPVDPRSVKVLDLINTSASAKELLRDRACYLSERYGVEAHIACSAGPYVEDMRQQGLTVHVLETPRQMRPFALAAAYVELIRLTRREGYDLLHSHGSVIGVLTRLARPLTKARIVHTVHGFHFHERMGWFRRTAYEAVERALLRLADATLSQNEEDFQVIQGWNPGARAAVIGNGVQLPRGPVKYVAREKPEYVLSCIARFEEVKNHRMLINVLRSVLDSGLRVRLICFGQGETLPDIEAYACELGLSGYVEFPGYVDDVFEHLDGVDLNLLTSIKEGVPRALIESMAIGIPSVATDVKGSREVVVDGVTGRLVPVDDISSFSEAVIDLLTDADRRQAMSDNGLKRAREYYDEAAICDRLYDLYVELCSEG